MMGKKNSNTSTLRDKVLEIITYFPEYIGNHNKIVLAYWNNYDPELTTPVLSITRTYQKLCAEGLIPLTAELALMRENHNTSKYKPFWYTCAKL